VTEKETVVTLIVDTHSSVVTRTSAVDGHFSLGKFLETEFPAALKNSISHESREEGRVVSDSPLVPISESPLPGSPQSVAGAPNLLPNTDEL
jgi:hypothetical protein